MAKRSLTAAAIEKLNRTRRTAGRYGIGTDSISSFSRRQAIQGGALSFRRHHPETHVRQLSSDRTGGSRAEAAKAQDTITSGVDPIEAQRRARDEGLRDRDLFENVVAELSEAHRHCRWSREPATAR